MTKDLGGLSGLQMDALREIGNIGAGNAATALAQMVGSKIDMNVPTVKIVPFTEVPDMIGGADRHVAGLYLTVEGQAPCTILFVLPIQQAALLVGMLMGNMNPDTSKTDFDEIETSAMMELGNILSATYLNALAMFTGLPFIPSTPALGIDMAGAVLDAILAQFGEIADHVLMLETEFEREGSEVVGDFFLLPEPESLETILTALGVNI